jgi:hypothetical protein
MKKSISVRAVIAASVIAAMIAGSECDNGKCGHRAADTRPLRQASKITASASSPSGNGDVSLA